MFMNQLNDLIDQPVESSMVIVRGGVTHRLDDTSQVGEQRPGIHRTRTRHHKSAVDNLNSANMSCAWSRIIDNAQAVRAFPPATFSTR